MKGDDAFLVVDYSAYVAPAPGGLHPAPLIERQDAQVYILDQEFSKILTEGAENRPWEGVIKLFVDIDGQQAISVSPVRSGWDKWIFIVCSFGVKCDNKSHEIRIRAQQHVVEIGQIHDYWNYIFDKPYTEKFEKPSAKKSENLVTKLKKKFTS